MEGKVTYFEKPGSENTDEVLRIAKLRAKEMGIKSIVIASTTGATAVRAVEALEGMRVIVVTHFTGHKGPNVQEFTEENRQKVLSKGGIIHTGTYALAGVDRAMRKKYNVYLLGDVVVNTLRLFGEGVKVACQVGLMAADAGLVRVGEDIIAIAGTDGGADTALVFKPVNSIDFLDLKIREILCKPHL